MEASSITFSDRSHIQPEIFMEITLDLVQNSDPDTTKLEKLIKFWQIKKRVLYGQVHVLDLVVGPTLHVVRKIFLFLESTKPSLMIALRELVPCGLHLVELQPKIGKTDLTAKGLSEL
jgi:hypothetical protein